MSNITQFVQAVHQTMQSWTTNCNGDVGKKVESETLENGGIRKWERATNASQIENICRAKVVDCCRFHTRRWRRILPELV